MPEPKLQGTVKSYNKVKGYGFISPSDGGKDVFLPWSTLEQVGLKCINIGQRVLFDTEADFTHPGKLCAKNLELR